MKKIDEYFKTLPVIRKNKYAMGSLDGKINVKKFYKEAILPKISMLEDYRFALSKENKEYKGRWRLPLIIGIIVILYIQIEFFEFLFALNLIPGFITMFMMTGSVMALFYGVYFKYYKKERVYKKKYRKRYVEEVVVKIIDIYFDKNIKYEHEKRVDFWYFKKSNLYPYVTAYKGEDKLKGLLNGLLFECSQTTAMYDMGKYYAFKGLFMVIGFDKIIKKEVVVKMKRGLYEKSRLGSISRSPKHYYNSHKIHKVNMNNLEFDSQI